MSTDCTLMCNLVAQPVTPGQLSMKVKVPVFLDVTSLSSKL